MLRHRLIPNASLVHIDSKTGRAVTRLHTIAVADSRFSKMFGQMFTNSIEEDYALIFPLGSPRHISLHMLFVPYDLGAIYLKDTKIVHMEIMNGWTGTTSGTADTIIEVHPTVLEQLTIGDQLYLQGTHNIDTLEEPPEAPDEPWFINS